MTAPRRYFIVSDLHLTDVEDHADGWKAYKSSRFVIDRPFAERLQAFQTDAPLGAELTLVLNGDIVDFDLVSAVPDPAPWKLTFVERRYNLDADEDRSVWKLERILAHHPEFLQALGAFLAAGHRVVWVLGNHDREFHFPRVQQALREALRRALPPAGAAPAGAAPPAAVPPLDAQLTFEPWFFAVPGEIYVEHGQQYDHYSSFRHVLVPTMQFRGREQIAVPMGNISNRYLLSRIGYFNPHASDYILNVFRYLAHWLRYYAFTRRSLIGNWLLGSLASVWRVVQTRRLTLRRPPAEAALMAAQATRMHLPLDTVQALAKLRETPIATRMFRILREFWIDRVIVALLLTGGTVALALVPIPLWIQLMVPLTAFPLLYFIYEAIVAGEGIFVTERRLPEAARRVAALTGARVVAFGHAHVPRLLPLAAGVTYVDTGTWAPVTTGPKGQGERLVPGYRNSLLVIVENGSVCLRFEAGT